MTDMENKNRSESLLSDQLQAGELVRFAVPKKGRLYERIVALLKGIGLQYDRKPRLDIAYCTNFPVQLVFLPAKDIATFVGEGEIDIGITGQDIIAEAGEKTNVDVVLHLGFGKCRLAVQAPVDNLITNPKELVGKRICTSFPELTKEYFTKLNPDVETPIKYISGSVEAACGLGLADAVVDLVETGTTMRAAGLEIVSEIMSTETVLIQNKRKKHEKTVELIRKRIEGYMLAQKYKMVYYNIERKNLEKAKMITPGKKSPTVQALDDPDWIAIGAMVPIKELSNVMDQLEEIGASSIFVVAIDNCRA